MELQILLGKKTEIKARRTNHNFMSVSLWPAENAALLKADY